MTRKWQQVYLQTKDSLENTTFSACNALEDMYDELTVVCNEKEELLLIIEQQKLQLDSCRRIIEGLGHQTNE